MLCVHCGSPADSVYQKFESGAFRLKICDHCKNVVDPLSEEDKFNVALDLLLHKLEAFRHVLFNRFNDEDVWLKAEIKKLTIVIILIECYAKTFFLEAAPQEVDAPGPELFFAQTKFPLAVFVCCAVSFVAYTLGAAFVCWIFKKQNDVNNPSSKITWAHFFAALVLGSYGKLGFFLMTVWDFEMHLRIPISIFVLTSTVKALQAVYGCESLLYPVTTVLSGMTCRWIAQCICVVCGLPIPVSFLL